MEGYKQSENTGGAVYLNVIEDILTQTRITMKTGLQMDALEYAANVLDRAGAHRDAAMLRYHAHKKEAILFVDDPRTRTALERATQAIKSIIYGEGANNGDDTKAEPL